MSLNQLAQEISEWREGKGFYTPTTIQGEGGEKMLGKLMLVVGEVAEASEAVRENDSHGFAEELADTMIRLLDICGTTGIDIEEEIRKKMIINRDRPYRHGKVIAL